MAYRSREVSAVSVYAPVVDTLRNRSESLKDCDKIQIGNCCHKNCSATQAGRRGNEEFQLMPPTNPITFVVFHQSIDQIVPFASF